MTLTPAYGRDYKSSKEACTDFDSGKDFIINEFGNRYDGKPVNKSQLGPGRYKLRYNNLRKLTLVVV